MGRGGLLLCRVLLAVVLCATPIAADEDPAVPVSLQAELLVKVAAYDKNMPARAGDRARVLIVSKRENARASRVAQQAERALSGKTVGKLALEVSIVEWSDAATLAKRIRGKRISILYLTPGFSRSELESVAKSLEGVDVLSAGAVAKQVQRGVVLGFDLVSGKPKLLVHLKRARRQNVNLSSKALKLMKVYE
jgi:hypothetical protein